MQKLPSSSQSTRWSYTPFVRTSVLYPMGWATTDPTALEVAVEYDESFIVLDEAIDCCLLETMVLAAEDIEEYCEVILDEMEDCWLEE